MVAQELMRLGGYAFPLVAGGAGAVQRGPAKAAGLSFRAIGRIERGVVDVRVSTLAKVAKAIGVDVTLLL